MSTRTLLTRLGQATAGIILGLGAAEFAFSTRDSGAFPHVNFYVEDSELGVRLRPGATERISFGGNPVHTATVNAEGYRGEDWGSPTGDEIIVLGDSQVFGLGVESNQTASAVLAQASKRTVRNAGVPTYGPPEYLAQMRELITARNPKTVVVVLNFANDLFERERPNTQRHKVWDGWAVRIETAPASVVNFPGRSWLFSQSHLVYAARRWLYTPWDPEDQGLPSEGGLADLIPVQSAAAPGDAAVAEQVQTAAKERIGAASDLERLYFDVFGWGDGTDELKLQALRDRATPGDIVGEYEAEGGRAIDVTAEFLRDAAALRKGFEPKLVEWAAKNPDDERAIQFQALLAKREEQIKTLTGLATEVARPRWADTPLGPFIDDGAKLCREKGVELTIVALPVDVQVSAEEWVKYGKPPIDMSATYVLLDDAVDFAQSRGVRALNAIPALAGAQPGAFLNADIHMSVTGQAALGKAIAQLLALPAPIASGGPGLPQGRSRVPTYAEMEFADEIIVKGSTRNHCSTRQLREWLLVDCAAVFDPPALTLQTGSLETMWSGGRQATRILTPLIQGRSFRARFTWKKADTDRDGPWIKGESQDLIVQWEGDKPVVKFLASVGPIPEAAVERTTADQAVFRLAEIEMGGYSPLRADPACILTYAARADRLECMSGSRAKLPTCGLGTINAGSGGFCAPACGSDRECETGQCLDWQGANVCL